MAHSTSGLGRKIFNLVGVYKASQGSESPMRYNANTKKKKSRLGRVVYVASFSSLFKSKNLNVGSNPTADTSFVHKTILLMEIYSKRFTSGKFN